MMKKHFYPLTCLLAALSLALTPVPAAAAQAGEEEAEAEQTATVETTSGRLRVRSGKGTDHDIVGYLHHGDTVTVLEMDGDWAKVKKDDLTGYCSVQYLVLAETEEEAPAPAPEETEEKEPEAAAPAEKTETAKAPAGVSSAARAGEAGVADVSASAAPDRTGGVFSGAFTAGEAGAPAGGTVSLALPEESSGTEDPAALAARTFGIREYVFTDAAMTCWLIRDSEIREAPYADAETAASLKRTDAVQVTGINEEAFWEISLDGLTAYVDRTALTHRAEELTAQEDAREMAGQLAMKRKAEETAAEAVRAEIKEEKEYAAWMASLATQTRSYYWNGPVLSRSNGSIMGPSGKETYYNLNMSGVVRIMRGMGVTGEYWVRNDGCKMLGNYIMCAANLSVHPRGSLVECSLGTCMVCDTGGFASHNPYQLDIATTW